MKGPRIVLYRLADRILASNNILEILPGFLRTAANDNWQLVMFGVNNHVDLIKLLPNVMDEEPCSPSIVTYLQGITHTNHYAILSN